MESMIKGTVSHSWEAETPEAKARWSQSLTLEERMDLLCDFTDLALSMNPDIIKRKDAEQRAKGIRIISLPEDGHAVGGR
jgi:hypothetical protein